MTVLPEKIDQIVSEMEAKGELVRKKKRNTLPWILLLGFSFISACTGVWNLYQSQDVLTMSESGFLLSSKSRNAAQVKSSQSYTFVPGMSSDDVDYDQVKNVDRLDFPPSTNGGVGLSATVHGVMLLPDTETRVNGVNELYFATSVGVIHFSGTNYYFLNEQDLNAAVYARKYATAKLSSNSGLSLSRDGRRLEETDTCVGVMRSVGVIDEHGVMNVHDVYDDCVDATMTIEDLNRLTFGNDSYGIDGRRLSDSSTLAAVQAQQIVNDPVQLTRTGQLDTSVYTAAISTEPLPVIPIIVKDQIINITTAINLDALSDEDFARHVSKLTKINVNQLQVVDENSAPSHAKHLFFRRKLRRAIRAVKVSIKPVIKKVVTNELISAVGKVYPKVGLVLAAANFVMNVRNNRKRGRRGRSRGRILEEDEEPNFSEITTGNHSPRNDFFFHSEDSPCFTALELKQRHAMIGNRPPNLVQLSKELPDKQIVVLSNSDIVCSTDTIFFDTIPTDTWRIPTPAPLDA